VLVERSSSLDDRCRQPTDDSRVARCCDRHHTRSGSLACDRHHASRPQERERVDRRENESQGVGPRHCGSGRSLDVDQPRESQLSRSRETPRRHSIHIEGRCLQSRSDDARDGDRRGSGCRSTKRASRVGQPIVRRSRRRLEHESLSVVDIVDQAMFVGGGRSTTELSRGSRGAREDQGSMARSIRVMWKSAKDRGTNNNCSNGGIINNRRIRNMVKQLDEIGRDRDPQVVSMIVFFLVSSCLVLLRLMID